MNGSITGEIISGGCLLSPGARRPDRGPEATCEEWEEVRRRIFTLVEAAGDQGQEHPIAGGETMHLLAALIGDAPGVETTAGELLFVGGMSQAQPPDTEAAAEDALLQMPGAAEAGVLAASADHSEGIPQPAGDAMAHGAPELQMEPPVQDPDTFAGQAEPAVEVGDGRAKEGDSLAIGTHNSTPPLASRPEAGPPPQGQDEVTEVDLRASPGTGSGREEEPATVRPRGERNPGRGKGLDTAQAAVERAGGRGEGLDTARAAVERAGGRGEGLDTARAASEKVRQGSGEGEVDPPSPEGEKGQEIGTQVSPTGTLPTDSHEGETAPLARAVRGFFPGVRPEPRGLQLRRGDEAFLRLRVKDLDSGPLTVRLRAVRGELVGRMQSADASLLRDLSGDIGSLRRNLESLGYASVDLQLGGDDAQARGGPRDRYRWQKPPGPATADRAPESGEVLAPAGTVNLLA